MAATNSYIQVAADGPGKKMQTYLGTVGTDDVHAEAVRLVDANLAPLGATGDSLNTAVKQFTAAASMFGGQVALTNVASTIAAARATRRAIVIRNMDATNSGYIGPSNVNTSNGLILRALESLSIDYIGIIQGITAGSNTANFGYLETYD